MNFRYGFLDIAIGRHPLDADWLSGLRQRNKSTSLRRRVQIFDYLTLGCQKNLSIILSDANIISISMSCKFPDWLGYLGLGLFHTETYEKTTRQITNSWILQLLQILPKMSYSHRMLQRIYYDESKVLSWRDLEDVEEDLKLSVFRGLGSD